MHCLSLATVKLKVWKAKYEDGLCPWPVFHQQFFPLWPLSLNFPYQIIIWFPMTVLAFPSPHSHPGICCSHDLSLQLSYFMCRFDSHSFYFFLPVASITPWSPAICLLLQLLFQRLRWCHLWPGASSVSALGLGSSHQLCQHGLSLHPSLMPSPC